MKVTLDDVCCLLHLPIQGRRFDHRGIATKTDGVDMMVELLGSTTSEAKSEVNRTRGAHRLFKRSDYKVPDNYEASER
jgi:hypothetical protein